jgi:hypothetical protein
MSFKVQSKNCDLDSFLMVLTVKESSNQMQGSETTTTTSFKGEL